MGNWSSPAWAGSGEVVEWLMAPVLKTGDPQGSVGSNPTLSVSVAARVPQHCKGSRAFYWPPTGVVWLARFRQIREDSGQELGKDLAEALDWIR